MRLISSGLVTACLVSLSSLVLPASADAGARGIGPAGASHGPGRAGYGRASGGMRRGDRGSGFGLDRGGGRFGRNCGSASAYGCGAYGYGYGYGSYLGGGSPWSDGAGFGGGYGGGPLFAPYPSSVGIPAPPVAPPAVYVIGGKGASVRRPSVRGPRRSSLGTSSRGAASSRGGGSAIVVVDGRSTSTPTR